MQRAKIRLLLNRLDCQDLKQDHHKIIDPFTQILFPKRQAVQDRHCKADNMYKTSGNFGSSYLEWGSRTIDNSTAQHEYEKYLGSEQNQTKTPRKVIRFINRSFLCKLSSAKKATPDDNVVDLKIRRKKIASRSEAKNHRIESTSTEDGVEVPKRCTFLYTQNQTRSKSCCKRDQLQSQDSQHTLQATHNTSFCIRPRRNLSYHSHSYQIKTMTVRPGTCIGGLMDEEEPISPWDGQGNNQNLNNF